MPPPAPPALITLRGNSASGKSALAERVRATYGRGVAIVGQDVLRRQVLRELPMTGGANVGLIELTTRHALEHGFHTVIEGILEASVYGKMLTGLVRDHREVGGPTASYYLDIPLSETLGRHTTKPIARQITEAQLTDWYLPHDTVPALDETILSDETSLDDWLCQVLTDTRLLDSPLRSLHATWDAPVNASRWR